ncbi:E3 ubiquitin-protein ligase PRT1-like [Salvia splendens]|uniref:E3 ubiquitin-protein ligase PRT1-like n=1 Tax=Salvia splendens TaxID=180675 RepID=UPI001C25EE15|nr:E3 ubiquitin-protein ligase PRT1-like [Salvia splendens]
MEQCVANRADMEEEEEEFPDEFQCCVCLDITYKPVVLACGHISCFWCTFKAMDSLMQSRCPVCRNPYNHFPRSCGLLHFLILKLYPSPYKRRAKQVAEEEKEIGYASPQFEGNIIESQLGEVDGAQDATGEGDHLSIKDFSQLTLPEDNTSIQPTSSSQTTTNDSNSISRSTKKVLETDVECAVCKQLLYRPVVLNCGHVYCESCIQPDDSIYRCPGCQSSHPRGIPSVCLLLHQFLEEYFPEGYSGRKISLAHSHSHSPSGSSAGKQEESAKASVQRANFHPGVGCDYCGICPITGVRYKCKDCVEKIGFDLCESCYKISAKLPGRFNQQHTMDHKFDAIRPQPNDFIMVLSSFGAELSAEDDGSGFGSEDDGVA